MKNGIYFEETNSGFGGVFVFYECGGFYEKPKFRGITHLSEHLACKSEKRFDKDIIMNGFNTNALTADDHVCFYYNGLEDLTSTFVEKYFSCRNYIPTEEEFETEKQIVIQEVQSAFCNYTLSIAFSRGLFNYYGALGDIESIRNLNYQDFIKFYKDIYNNPSVVVFTGGKNMKKAYNRMKDKIAINTTQKKRVPINMLKTLNKDSYEIWSNKDSNSVLLFREFKTKERSQVTFLICLLSDGFYSPFNEYLRETKKLCYYIMTYIENLGKNTYINVWTETDKEVEFIESFFEILNNFEKFVTKDYYELYIKKLINDYRVSKIKKDYSLLYRKYIVDKDNLFNKFEPSNPLFSYNAMIKLIKKVSKRNEWKKMTHFKDKIEFTETV